MEDYVERGTTVARKRVDDPETAIKQEQEETSNAENMGLNTREHKKLLDEMMVAIGDSLCNLAHSLDEEHEADEDDVDTELGNLSEDNEPG